MKKTLLITLTGIVAFISACTTTEQCKVNTFKASADFSADNGKIKPMNGSNLGPNIYNGDSGGGSVAKDIAKLNIPITRLHDVSLKEPGLKIVDTDLIFPHFHVDENDPRNYVFAPTDDYINQILSQNTKIFYRLGVSIDHSLRKYRTEMPPDPEKWARICIKIIEHYNEGWNNGFKHNIEYWEIWNEPDCVNPSGRRTMWNGTYDEYVTFYCKVAKIIKNRFPHLKIGGPAITWLDPVMLKKLTDGCKRTGAPLDFFSWHSYPNKVENIIAQPVLARKLLDKEGFKNTEIHLNEWHYFPLKWSELRSEADKKVQYAKLHTLESGVFTASVMTALQDTPLDYSYYYYAAKGGWGIFDNYGIKHKSYYGNLAFGQIFKYPNRVKATSSNKGVYTLAGKDANGNKAMLVNLFKTGKGKLEISLNGVDKAALKNVKVYMYDDAKNLEETSDFSINGNVLTVPIISDSSAVLLKM